MSGFSRLLHAFSRSRRGQAMVEFALVVPIFLLTVTGLLEGSRLVFSNVVLSYAVQQAGRTGALASTADVATVKTAAVNNAFTLNLPASAVTVAVSGSTTTFTARQKKDIVTVSASYDYAPLVAWVFTSLPTIPLSTQTQYRAE